MNPSTAAERRAEGRARRARRARSPAADARLRARRAIPYVDLFGDEAVERVEAQADRLLERIGVEYRDDDRALEIWREAGAEVVGTRVRHSARAVRELCAKAPSEFVQHARNPVRSVRIGGPEAVFAPVYGPPFVRCLDGGRRYGTIEDFRRLVRLTHALPSLHHSGGTTCEPCDLPVNKRHLDMVHAHLTLTDKPFLGSITAMERAEDSIEMARLAFGAKRMETDCTIMGNVNVNSPLVFDRVASEAIRAYCGANQGIVIVPFVLGGAMGPVTTAGAVAQALAEAMSGVAFAQLVRPGAPVVLGNFLSSMSLRSGAPTFGMPEAALSSYLVGQLARRLALPLRCGGSLTASKLCDAQAAYESADSMNATALAGAHFVLHAAGWLESGLVTGYEKLVLDADRLAALHVLLAGVATDDNALGVDAYADVEPGGHFLGGAHTMANYESAYFDAALSDSESFESWTERGSKDAAARANARWKRLLDEHEPPPLDPGVAEALDDFVARRKAASPDAWH